MLSPPTRFVLPALIAATVMGGWPEPAAAARDANPCLEPAKRKKLRCPDLRMSPPFNMYTSRSRSGRLRLHAGNSINSMGRGPAELRGRRTSRWMMRARQVVYKRGGGKRYLDTGAKLGFKAIPGQYRYWKFKYAAEFELWRLDKRGRRIKLVRGGPKVSYCLRDLAHTFPSLPGSPRFYHYPACSQNFSARRVTLGTSVGWSDVYPSTYHEQYLYVDNLRGCFSYRHVADPRNGIYESNEDNNIGETIVRLPWRGAGRHGCPKRSRPKKDPVKGGGDGGTGPGASRY